MVARTDCFRNPTRSFAKLSSFAKFAVQLAIRRGQNELEHTAEVTFHHQLLPSLYLCYCRGMFEILNLSRGLLQLCHGLILRCVNAG